MNALLVKNGLVINAIVVDSIENLYTESPEWCSRYDAIIESTGEHGCPWIGWTYSDGVFTEPAPQE